MDELDKVYEKTIKHIETVAIGALNMLPNKYKTYSTAIKNSVKNPAELGKIKDFEYVLNGVIRTSDELFAVSHS